eukprot:5493263-Amphidinium_carterae.1
MGSGANAQAQGRHVSFFESKRSGAFRYCKYCGQSKPDRAHHCKAMLMHARNVLHNVLELDMCAGLQKLCAAYGPPLSLDERLHWSEEL